MTETDFSNPGQVADYLDARGECSPSLVAFAVEVMLRCRGLCDDVEYENTVEEIALDFGLDELALANIVQDAASLTLRDPSPGVIAGPLSGFEVRLADQVRRPRADGGRGGAARGAG